MSSSLDKDLLLTLEEEDVPFDLPNLPQYCSSEKNVLSVIGRILNPDCQMMSDLILDMPRKWQLYDRVKGVALSKERFQFIFKYEHDLEEILNKGVHSFNLWTLAMKRWVEKPQATYLQHIMIWVQLRNIPVNHYTLDTITAFGEFAGQVVDVAYDPEKAQSKEYVRVKVRFDVSKQLRRSKLVNIPSGESVTILYDYERIQKRCYWCQRLTHEKGICPLYKRKLQEENGQGQSREKEIFDPVIKASNPLFGVLTEDQVGMDMATGRVKMAAEVLEGCSDYLMAVEGPERIVREARVKRSVADLDKDPRGQKSMLRLELPPDVSSELDKGK